ncbi:MAG: transglutaminase domain-containing protein [Bacteroidetes bacterium]|nr:transglutaminase domain-containing protein [Bacteroidota bacterium]
MKKTIFILLFFCSLYSKGQEKHFLTDESYRKHTFEMFEKQKLLAEKRNEVLFDVFNQQLTLEEKEALVFLYAYMPLSDLADYQGSFYLQEVRASLLARQTFSWGKTIPEIIFRHFVLPYRVNNENLDTARIVFFNELKDRIKNMSMKDAALEVNHWCHEKVAYKGCDSRTSAPLATVKNALGRCGEESTFTVTAMRAVGIPARQCYTPRWAHSDDNHAWVEVWIDGKWHFLGACEPEPDLDLGWFAAPSKRCMMVNTTVFGYYLGDEEVLQKDERFTKINLLANYAPVKPIYVKVKNTANQLVDSAKVEFQLYNYAEFYPLAVKTTAKDGMASLRTGYGDLLIWASKDNSFGFEKLTVENKDTITVILNKKSGKAYTLAIDLTPPVPREVEVKVSEEARNINNIRLKYEDSLRKAYENTFIDSMSAIKFAKSYNLAIDKTLSVLLKSRGNWREIQQFISRTGADFIKICLPLLEAISEKDLHDVSKEVLFDHLYYAKITDLYDFSMMVNYLINPRIGDEMIKPYKKFIKSVFPDDNGWGPIQIADWIKSNIKIDNTANYYRLPLTPKAAIELGVCDATSRDILFVAICRSLGIASRLEPATKIPQYYDWQGWNNMLFEKAEKTAITKATIILQNDSSNALVIPEYSTHYTIQKFNNGKYNTLDYEMDEQLKKFPASINVEAGDYLMVTGNRKQDGSVLASLQFFSIKPNQTLEMPVKLRKSKQGQKVLGKLKQNIEFENDKTKKTVKYKAAKGKYSIFFWLEPGKEPTKHAIVDISKLKSNFEKWGGDIYLILPKSFDKAFDYQLVNEMPLQSIVMRDKSNLLKEIEIMTKQKLTDNLPVILVVNDKNEIIYISKAYKIGSGEQLLKLF